MKTLIKVFAGIIAFLIISVGIMAVFKISPPPGPWPQPPWSKNFSGSYIKALTTVPTVYLPEYQEVLESLSGAEWKKPEDIKKRFITGNVYMDMFSDRYYHLYFEPTLASMKKNNGQWVIFDNYWAYSSLKPPAMENLYASEEQLASMITKTHQNGQKFALMIELNWEKMRGAWQGWEYERKFWEESAGYLEKMGNNLSKPTAEVNEYWVKWFEAYTQCVLWHADIAQKYGADMLVIGKQLDGAVKPGNNERWLELIKKTRKVYQGKIGYAAYTRNGYSQLDEAPWTSELDVPIIYMYNEINDQAAPSITELKKSFEEIFTAQTEKYAVKYNKKVILLTPFQSRDYGGMQVWFEPAAAAPEVGRDLLLQAKLYEALFQALEDEAWIEGIWTWGYWWQENYFNQAENLDASFDKSSSIRNKPAGEVVKKWSIQE